MSYMIGVDVGGTFTDLSVFNAERDSIFNYKLSSTPGDPSQAIVDGMRYSGNWAALFAAVVLVFLPTLIMFIFLSEKIMGGVTAGAVKG